MDSSVPVIIITSPNWTDQSSGTSLKNCLPCSHLNIKAQFCKQITFFHSKTSQSASITLGTTQLCELLNHTANITKAALSQAIADVKTTYITIVFSSLPFFLHFNKKRKNLCYSNSTKV